LPAHRRGGVACLWAIFDELDIESMEVSEMALREGLIYDLHGRIHDEDVRERTLRGLLETYRPETAQANRVTQAALGLLYQVEKALMAALVRGQRRKFPPFVFDELPAPERAARLCRVLRLAVVLHRGRTDMPLPSLQVLVDGPAMRLEFPPDWLEEHPLTQPDLRQEACFLSAVGLALDYA